MEAERIFQSKKQSTQTGNQRDKSDHILVLVPQTEADLLIVCVWQ